jgi:acetate kinase
MTNVILTVNSGSSSIKFALFPADDPQADAIMRGKIAGIGRQPVVTAVRDGQPLIFAAPLDHIAPDAKHEWLIAELLNRLHEDFADLSPVAVGHRVVHGGQDFTGPARVTPESRAAMAALTPLAPLHQPMNLAAIDAIAQSNPSLPQVACFDTAFHRTQPRLAQMFGIPRALTDEGIIRYGFHGLSYAYIASILPDLLGERAKGRVIVAHLGNGASMCAMKECKSVATTMGFTALDGLIMGRRCGSLDPGVALHLAEQKGMSVHEIHEMLYRQSGLLGVSGVSNSMQDLAASDHPHAREAIALFCYRARQHIGSLTAALGGLDALIFTAGIGEHSAETRAGITSDLDWLGLHIDPAANARGDTEIHSKDSVVAVLKVRTDEERIIADSTRGLL